MIEHHKIKGKDVWVEVLDQPADRDNYRTIPTEYFTAKYYLEEPPEGAPQWILNDEGEPQLFESPVAALTFATKTLMNMM